MTTFKAVLHWVNSLPSESCLLASSPEDLTDGRVIGDIIACLEGGPVKESQSVRTSSVRVRASLCFLGKKYGFSSLPPIVTRWDAADQIQRGNAEVLVPLLQFLRSIASRGSPAEINLAAPAEPCAHKHSVFEDGREVSSGATVDDAGSPRMCTMSDPGSAGGTAAREQPDLQDVQEAVRALKIKKCATSPVGLPAGGVPSARGAAGATKGGQDMADEARGECREEREATEEGLYRPGGSSFQRSVQSEVSRQAHKATRDGPSSRPSQPAVVPAEHEQLVKQQAERRAAAKPRVRLRPQSRRCAAIELDSRLAWNGSTLIERPKTKVSSTQRLPSAGSKNMKDEMLSEAANAVMQRAGRLDQNFRLVRCLQHDTMFDPTYRATLAKPVPAADRGGCSAGDSQACTAAASPVHQRQQCMREAQSNGLLVPVVWAQGDSVQVLGSVHALLERPLGGDTAENYEQGVRESLVIHDEGGAQARENIKSGTDDGQRRILCWMKSLGVRVSPEWLGRCEAGSLAKRRSTQDVERGTDAEEAAALKDFVNGVTLCELAAAVETLIDAARARGKLRVVPGERRFVVPGTCLRPKNFAQVLHNVERALEVLQNIPRECNTRHLVSAHRVAKGDPAVIWELLGDLYDAYHLPDPEHKRATRQKIVQPHAQDHAKAATRTRPVMQEKPLVLLEVATCDINGGVTKSPPRRKRLPSRSRGAVAMAEQHNESVDAVEAPRDSAPQPTMSAAEPAALQKSTSQGGVDVAKERDRRLMSLAEDRLCEASAHVSHSINGLSSQTQGNGGPPQEHAIRSPPASPVRGSLPTKGCESSPRRKRVRQRDAHASDYRTVLQHSLPMMFDEDAAELSDNLPPVTTPQISLTRQWLHSRSVDAPDAEIDERHFLDDPLRNGVYLSQLLAEVDPGAATHAKLLQLLHRRPTSLKQVQENMARALWLFKLRCSPPVPARYLSDPDGLILGDFSLTWGLLWHIMKAYASPPWGRGYHTRGTACPQASDESFVCKSLGYSLAQKQQLEHSLVSWIVDLGLLDDDFYGDPCPNDLLPLEHSLRDGTLLCRLVEVVTDRHIKGWNPDPRTREVAVGNVCKAVDVLRRWRPMSKRHLGQGVEDAWVSGKWTEILGLLEDLHRAADGLPPRPAVRASADVPYLGGRTDLPTIPTYKPRRTLLLDSPPRHTSPQRGRCRAEHDTAAAGASGAAAARPQATSSIDIDDEEDVVRYKDSDTDAPYEVDPLERGRELDILPRLPERGGWAFNEQSRTSRERRNRTETTATGRSPARSNPDPTQDLDLYPMDDGESLSADGFGALAGRLEDLIPSGWEEPEGLSEDEEPVAVDAAPESRTQMSDALHVSISAGQFQASNGAYNALNSFISGSTASPLAGSANLGLDQRPGSIDAQYAHTGADDDEEVIIDSLDSPAGPSSPTITAARHRDRHLEEVQGLIQWLSRYGIALREPERLLTPTAPEFSDGVQLAALVQRLEGMRDTLQNVDFKPKARAARLQNIRRVCAVLKNKQAIPLQLLHREFEILEGSTEVLVPLLMYIKKAYHCTSARAST